MQHLSLKDSNVANHQSYLLTSMLLPLQTMPLTMVFVCKSYYINCLILKELDGNPTYTPTTHVEFWTIHRSVLCSFRIATKDEELDLLSLLDTQISSVSLQTALCLRVCPMLQKKSFQIINIYLW